MLKVRVNFDSAESEKTIHLEGYTSDVPKIGKDFSILMRQKDNKIQVDFGKVFNIQYYSDRLLIQTSLIVAEVWVLEGEGGPTAEVHSFIKNPKVIYLKGGKITSLRQGGTKAQSLHNFKKSLIELRANTVQTKPKPALRLIKGV